MRKSTVPMKSRKAGRSGTPRRSEAKRPRGTGAIFVYESLKAQILDLELQPGTLLDETELSHQFGVSRSPVREALIRLSAERLVQNLRNRTSIVAPFDVANLPAYFDAMILIYRLSARLAAGHADPAAIDRLRETLRHHEAALQRGDMKAIVRLNREFHVGVAQMTGNSYFVDWMQGLLDQGQRVLRLYARHLGDTLSGEVLQSHRDMIEAIAVGNAEKAEDAGRRDANVLVEEFRKTLSDLPASHLSLRTESPCAR